jgi:hypothetical protein
LDVLAEFICEVTCGDLQLALAIAPDCEADVGSTENCAMKRPFNGELDGATGKGVDKTPD